MIIYLYPYQMVLKPKTKKAIKEQHIKKEEKKKALTTKKTRLVLVNFLRKALLHNIWLVSPNTPKEQEVEKSIHEVLYIIVYFVYSLFNISGYELSYNDIEDIRNKLKEEKKIKKIIDKTQKILKDADNFGKIKKSNISNKLFIEFFENFGVNIKFPGRGSKLAKDNTNIYYGGGFNPQKKIQEIIIRKNIRVLEYKKGVIVSRKESGINYILNYFFSLIRFRVGEDAYASDDIILNMFLDFFEKLLKERKGMDRFAKNIEKTTGRTDIGEFFNSISKRQKHNTLKTFFETIADNETRSSVLSYLFKNYRDEIRNEMLGLRSKKK